ncbi:hypothetical protein L3X38_005149 [Prunus dulcis]|uniref:Pectin lyase-like superfamily protein n=1 Tax=Prunus dulcis TaxID=3755 RepID=A0AAD4ZQB0_PRUDU|nr:hypothetical protein L3X38_005149 [Prunus dulcis]
MTKILVTPLIFYIASSQLIGFGHSQITFDVLKYGVVGDPKTNDSRAFVKAWEELCGASDEANGVPTLVIPEQKLSYCSPSSLKVLATQIVFMFSISWKNWWHPKRWMHGKGVNHRIGSNFRIWAISWLMVEIDGHSSSWWTTPNQYDTLSCKLLQMNKKNCKALDALHFHGCDNLKLHPNTDGIDISSSHNVFIQHSTIGTGDDYIAINGGCFDLNIANIVCGPGHGISLGANGQLEKVENVYVRDCSFSGTTGSRRGRANPGTSASEEAIKLDCDQNSSCHNIIMDRIKVTSDVPGKKIYASCNNNIGTSIGTIVPNVPCLKVGAEPTTYSPATPPQALPLPPTPLPSLPLPVTPPPSLPMPSTYPPSPPMLAEPSLALILPAPHLLDTPPASPPVLATPPPSPPMPATPPLALILPATPPPLTATSSPSLPMPATPLPILPPLAPPLPNKPRPTLPLPTMPPLAPPLPNRPRPLPLPTMPSPAPPLPFTPLASLVSTLPPPALPATRQMSFKGNSVRSKAQVWYQPKALRYLSKYGVNSNLDRVIAKYAESSLPPF